MKPKYISVYGTLRRSQPNNYLLGNSEYMGTHTTQTPFLMFSLGGFPGVVYDGETGIVVDVYLVSDPKVMVNLDILEGIDSGMYKHGTALVDGLATMIYVWNGRWNDRPIVRDGDWVSYRKELYGQPA